MVCTKIELDYSPGWAPDKEGAATADGVSDDSLSVTKLEGWK